jgi:hypothetical protein
MDKAFNKRVIKDGFVANNKYFVNNFFDFFDLFRFLVSTSLTHNGFYPIFRFIIRFIDPFLRPKGLLAGGERSDYEQSNGLVYGCPVKAFLRIDCHQGPSDS